MHYKALQKGQGLHLAEIVSMGYQILLYFKILRLVLLGTLSILDIFDYTTKQIKVISSF